MMYDSTSKAEMIWFCPANDDGKHFIAMKQDGDDATFSVICCCNEDWEWKFHYTASNYDLVKHTIFDVGFDCGDMRDLMDELDCLFEDIFEDIVVYDYDSEWDCDCDGNCEHCNCR